MATRLQEAYQGKIRPNLKKEFGYTSDMQVPRLEKIVVNMGVSALLEKSALDDAARDMTAITGRKPVIAKAKKSVANFKLRQGYPIGCYVTLRREVMYEFFDRLVCAALPRIRDFRGISAKSFDGRGNYSMGIADQSIFPEIDIDKVTRTQGMDVTIVTSAQTDDEAFDLLKLMGMPFAGNRKGQKEEKKEEAATA